MSDFNVFLQERYDAFSSIGASQDIFIEESIGGKITIAVCPDYGCFRIHYNVGDGVRKTEKYEKPESFDGFFKIVKEFIS